MPKHALSAAVFPGETPHTPCRHTSASLPIARRNLVGACGKDRRSGLTNIHGFGCKINGPQRGQPSLCMFVRPDPRLPSAVSISCVVAELSVRPQASQSRSPRTTLVSTTNRNRATPGILSLRSDHASIATARFLSFPDRTKKILDISTGAIFAFISTFLISDVLSVQLKDRSLN